MVLLLFLFDWGILIMMMYSRIFEDWDYVYDDDDGYVNEMLRLLFLVIKIVFVDDQIQVQLIVVLYCY
jgi:hypothetical protein